ncbi:MAG: DUF998 domain-containing protein, partial [Pseudolysinimonas sp.]
MSSAIRPLSVAAFVAQILFLLTWLLGPLWQGPNYSWLAHSISDMYAVTAPGGLVFVVVFTITGAITILFALITVWRTFRPGGWTAAVGSILLALSIFGLGDLLTAFERLACRLADAGCTAASQVANAGGTLDSILSTIGLGVFVAAAVFLSVAMAKTSGWRSWAWPTRAVAAAMLAVFFADGALGGSGLGGLLERILAALGALAIALLAL